jgi:hypothetical protein
MPHRFHRHQLNAAAETLRLRNIVGRNQLKTNDYTVESRIDVELTKVVVVTFDPPE